MRNTGPRWCDAKRRGNPRLRDLTSLAKQQPRRKKQMKKLLLIALVASGLAFVPVQPSDAQIFIGLPGFVGIGIGPGPYFGYPYYGQPQILILTVPFFPESHLN